MKFDTSEIENSALPDYHKIFIADCILAWAKFDSLLRVTLTAVEKRHLDEGARSYNRLKASMAWDKLIKALRLAGASDGVLDAVKERKQEHERHSEVRNIIAHANCAGVWRTRPDHLIFAPFDSDAPSEMVIIAIPLAEIERATQWAREIAAMLYRIVEAAGY